MPVRTGFSLASLGLLLFLGNAAGAEDFALRHGDTVIFWVDSIPAARVYICAAAITAEDTNKSENGFLQKMCDEGMAQARSLGSHAIDVQRTMRAIQKKVWAANATVADKSKHTTLHAADGIHLNDLGQ